MAHLNFDPEWKKFEKDMHAENNDIARDATDRFLAAREHALKTDKAAKRWEEGRKAGWNKDKPGWVKQRVKHETDASKKLVKELRTGGSYDKNLHPAAGFLIVEPNEKEEVTKGGIFLPDETDAMQNTGKVVDVGGETKDFKPPCKKGDEIMYKKGAGITLGISGKDCLFMGFQDVLGVFYV